MTTPDSEIVSHRLQRARDAMEDAHVLAQSHRWNACVNRLYYACFYAVSAPLAREGLSASRHTGVRSLFNQYFVHAGKVDKAQVAVYYDLFERRREGDYVDFVQFEQSQVQVWLPAAETFVEHVARLLAVGDK